MSRIPQPQSSRTTSKSTSPSTPTTPTRPRVLNSITSTSNARTRTQSTTATGRAGTSTPTSSTTLRPTTPGVRKTGSAMSLKTKVPATPKSKPGSPTKLKPSISTNVNAHAAPEKVPPTPSMSIREAIALKRAEAKKTQAKSVGGALADMSTLEEALPPHAIPTQEEEDLLGRATLREAIEKARSTGSLNLATRSLKCLPSALFEIHLNITPEPLKSVPDEAPLPPAPVEPSTGRISKKKPAWFEAQDLHVIKAWGNEIQEVQHEISLFGSLKVIDLHNNKLASIPHTLADLSILTNLDLSHNQLTTLPDVFFALPELTNLNLSHNSLTSLPFNAFFATSGTRTRNNHNSSTDFFAPQVVRATSPLPKLLILNVFHNQITSDSIDLTLPKTLVRVDLSENPLGSSQSLLKTLSSLPRLKELILTKSDIDDSSFPASYFSSSPSALFPSLKLLDLSETKVTLETITTALKDLKQELNHDFVNDEPPEGVTRVLVGKKIIKEAWEIELEKRAQHRVNKSFDLGGEWDEMPSATTIRPSSASPTPSTASTNVASVRSSSSRATTSRNIQEVVKEAWEVEAEAGLTTEGGRRRARAAAAAAAASNNASEDSHPANGNGNGVGMATLSSPQYYDQSTQTLTLPASQPPKAGHNRAFSLAAKMSSTSSAAAADMTVPVQSLPLNIIAVQSFAHSLRALILSNRRADRSFTLPSTTSSDPQGFLPCLEELDLEGCNFSETVSVLRVDAPSPNARPPTPPSAARSTEPLLPLLATLFPSLRTLNLSYNMLPSSAFTRESLSALILSSPAADSAEEGVVEKKGLRHLRLRGNRITDLDGFTTIAEMFRGNRVVSEWKLEELDLRDNEIGRLSPELGLLPLDVFLVDGNTFRVPQRRVWEREGTKGLLSWLRGRIE
ncbi:hypothetical protein NP233_g10241 [Leucocoprinus birnbaumii]|uniref:L domain-like protein n=1 Tax=Leucocoprinus birnbaumii TaxID=56174 RepID=A0AAD5YLH6_9AGAR|nr:hypothetical protein NP233_g10241 [Leucocoprinus birnbaumii]